MLHQAFRQIRAVLALEAPVQEISNILRTPLWQETLPCLTAIPCSANKNSNIAEIKDLAGANTAH